MFNFQKEFPFDKRSLEAKKVHEKYPERVPIIIETSADLPYLDKKKYLVPKEFTVGQFISILRKRIKLAPEKAIFLFVNNTIPPVSQLIGRIDEQHRSPDGFVYFFLAGENSFG